VRERWIEEEFVTRFFCVFPILNLVLTLFVNDP
jgi:hypothetical protein